MENKHCVTIRIANLVAIAPPRPMTPKKSKAAANAAAPAVQTKSKTPRAVAVGPVVDPAAPIKAKAATPRAVAPAADPVAADIVSALALCCTMSEALALITA